MGEFGRWLVAMMLIIVIAAGLLVRQGWTPGRLLHRRNGLHGGLLVLSSLIIAGVALYDTIGVGQPLRAWEVAGLSVLASLQAGFCLTVRRRILRPTSEDSKVMRHNMGDI